MSVAGHNTLLNEETAALASKGAMTVAGYGTTVWYATKVPAARGDVSVAGKKAAVSLIHPGIPVPLGALTVAAVSPVYAMRAELRTKLLQSSQDLFFQEYMRRISEELEKAGKIRVNPNALDQVARSVYY